MMIRLIRHPLLAAVMVAVMVLTGHAMASARGMPGAAGEITLCTGTGPLTVLADENGQPVAAPHICPDCALGLFAAVWGSPEVPQHPVARADVLRPVAILAFSGAYTLAAVARSPPVIV